MEGLSLYKTDKYGNKLNMLSYVKFKDDITEKDIIEEFSKAIRISKYPVSK